MLHKNAQKITIFLLTLTVLSSCGGFYQPVTLRVDIPDGPPEFKAGWRAGCRTALATKTFANSFVYSSDYGNGTLQHDPSYTRAWGRGWFACILHTANFVNAPSMMFMPLQK